jgi:hypothetical protein
MTPRTAPAGKIVVCLAFVFDRDGCREQLDAVRVRLARG